MDRKGLLWFSLGRKAYCYDGYKLTDVPIVRAGQRNVRYVGTGRFVEDRDENLWLLDVESKLYKYEPTSSEFLPYGPIVSGDLTDETIDLIYASEASGLWLGLRRSKLMHIDPFSEQIVNVIDVAPYIPSNDNVAAIASTKTDQILAISSTGILLKCNAYSSSCATLDLRNLADSLTGFNVVNLLPRKKNSLVIQTSKHGIYELQLGPEALVGMERLDQIEDVSLVGNDVWDMHVSITGDLWIATPHGLYVGSPGKSLARIDSANSGQQVPAVIRFENLGMGKVLVQSPTDVYLLRKNRFETHYASSNNINSIITAFSQGSEGPVWVGSLAGLRSLGTPTEEGLIELEDIPTQSSLGAELMAMHHDGNESLWLGGTSGGLRILETSKQNSRTIIDGPEVDAISAIESYDSDTLIIGTPNRGAHLLTKSGRRLWSSMSNSRVALLMGDTVFAILRSSKGNILVGGDKGLTALSITRNRERVEIDEVNQYLSDHVIFSILKSSNGDTLVGTHQQGLYRSKSNEDDTEFEFLPVATSPELPDSTIYAIEEDELGLLWLSTNKGLVRLNPETSEITVFTESDGISDDEFNLGASLKDNHGYLYFGGNNGLIRFDPTRFSEFRTPPPLRLTEIMIHREPVPYDPAYVEIPELVLDHKDHSLDVEFSTMDIISPGRSRYKYQLVNFDSDWVDIGTRNSATFTSLPAGEYVLRVIGADAKGVWNYDGIVLPIRVLPAPWLTWWAFTLYALLLMAVVTLIKRFYDTHLEKVAATREAEDMKITATLAMDDLQDQLEVENRLVDHLRRHATNTFDMVDEFLTLELEELYGEEIEESLGRARQRLHCLQALEASVYFHGDLPKVNFRDAIDRGFAEVIKAHPHPAAELVLANDCSEELVPIDIAAPLLLLAHELILNSVLHAFPESQGVECIEVSFRPDAGNWIFELSDSGCGLPTAIDPARPTTLGMELVTRIASRLGAAVEVNRDKGTQFRVSMPRIYD